MTIVLHFITRNRDMQKFAPDRKPTPSQVWSTKTQAKMWDLEKFDGTVKPLPPQNCFGKNPKVLQEELPSVSWRSKKCSEKYYRRAPKSFMKCPKVFREKTKSAPKRVTQEPQSVTGRAPKCSGKKQQGFQKVFRKDPKHCTTKCKTPTDFRNRFSQNDPKINPKTILKRVRQS